MFSSRDLFLLKLVTVLINEYDNGNILFDHNVQIEITIFKTKL